MCPWCNKVLASKVRCFFICSVLRTGQLVSQVHNMCGIPSKSRPPAPAPRGSVSREVVPLVLLSIAHIVTCIGQLGEFTSALGRRRTSFVWVCAWAGVVGFARPVVVVQVQETKKERTVMDETKQETTVQVGVKGEHLLCRC